MMPVWSAKPSSLPAHTPDWKLPMRISPLSPNANAFMFPKIMKFVEAFVVPTVYDGSQRFVKTGKPIILLLEVTGPPIGSFSRPEWLAANAPKNRNGKPEVEASFCAIAAHTVRCIYQAQPSKMDSSIVATTFEASTTGSNLLYEVPPVASVYVFVPVTCKMPWKGPGAVEEPPTKPCWSIMLANASPAIAKSHSP